MSTPKRTVTTNQLQDEAIEMIISQGWQELPGFWRRALTEQRRRVANGVKADIRRRQRKARRA